MSSFIKDAYEIHGPRPWWQRPVSSTVGRINPATVLPWLLMTHPTVPFKKWTDERQQEVKDIAEGMEAAFRDEENRDTDEAAVYLGSDRPFDRLKRIWKRDNLSIPGKLIGTLKWPINALIPPLFRSDFYDPYANTATVYNADPRIAAHEMGHEVDWSRRKWKTMYDLAKLIPGVDLYQEWQASSTAPEAYNQLLKNPDLSDEEKEELERKRKELPKLTGPAYGSYVGRYIGGLIPPIAMRFAQPESFKRGPKDEDVDEIRQKANKILAAVRAKQEQKDREGDQPVAKAASTLEGYELPVGYTDDSMVHMKLVSSDPNSPAFIQRGGIHGNPVLRAGGPQELTTEEQRQLAASQLRRWGDKMLFSGFIPEDFLAYSDGETTFAPARPTIQNINNGKLPLNLHPAVSLFYPDDEPNPGRLGRLVGKRSPDERALKLTNKFIKKFKKEWERLNQQKQAKAKSKSQQRFMGMVHAVQKGEMRSPSKEVAEAAKSMDKEDVTDYAETKHNGLPNKKKTEKKSFDLSDVTVQNALLLSCYLANKGA